MSEAIEVEVPGPVVCAAVSADMVEQYLERTGWERANSGERWGLWRRDGFGANVPLDRSSPSWDACMAATIENVAIVEGRVTHLVLADIVAEVVDEVDCAPALTG